MWGLTSLKINVDGKLYKSPTVTFVYDFLQRHILVVSDNYIVKKKLRLCLIIKSRQMDLKVRVSVMGIVEWIKIGGR